MASIQAEKGMQEDDQIFLFWYTIKMYCIHDVDVQLVQQMQYVDAEKHETMSTTRSYFKK